MILIDRRRALEMSVDKLHRLSGVPVTRIHRLELGVDSLKLVPFYQAAALAKVLDVSLDEWYNCVCCDTYDIWLRKRRVDNA